MFSSATRITDVLAVISGGWIAYWMRHDWAPGREELLVLLLAIALAIIVLPLTGAYRSWKGVPGISELMRALVGWFAVVTILVFIGAATKTTAEFSRLWIAYWTAITVFMLVILRITLIIMGNITLTKGLGKRRIAIVGTGSLAKHVSETLGQRPELGLEVAGFISAEDMTQSDRLPVIGGIDDLENLTGEYALKEVWVALPLAAESQVEATLNSLQNCLLTVRYIPDIFALRLLNHIPTRIANLLTIELNASPLEGANRWLKNTFDFLFALCALIIGSPILLLVAVLVKATSPGPVFFSQLRHGTNGKPIRIYKFRSMYHEPNDKPNFVQATKNDPRVTPIGHFLRRTSIDELPQFFNVLQGRLSVVGPRPHAIAHNDAFKNKINAYMQRHRVKPGITGWAQVNGYRGETDTMEKMQKRIEFDLYYIENWTIWLDIKIIFLTIFFVLAQHEAY